MRRYKVALVYLNRDHNVGIGVGSIASAILEQGHRLMFFDTAYTPVESVASQVASGGFDFLLLSANTPLYRQAVRLAGLVKQSVNVTTMLGGLHTTIMRGQVLSESPEIDYICVGEGEDFVLDFLSSWGTDRLEQIQNLGYRDSQRGVRVNSVRPCTDLSKLSPFHWGLFSEQSIINPDPLPGFCYVFATRGCPYACTYCCNMVWLGLYQKSYLRRRPIDKILEELRWLKERYPVQTFYFADEMILSDMDYTTELLHRYQREISLPYGCMARVERITPEVVQLFRQTYCVYVGMGIECGDEKFRRTFLNRQMSNEQIIQAFSALRGVPGLKTSSYNMRGYPVEYDEELTKSTLALNDLIKPDFMGLSYFYPFPGTKLYDYCVEHDKIDPIKAGQATEYYSGSVLR